MNYRHAFHAGNFADVVKHAMLSRILTYLTLKPNPVRYIDTHAGVGWYDLTAPEAERTGEWRDGIGRVTSAVLPDAVRVLLGPYLDAVGPCDPTGRPLAYPGSPALAQSLLRPIDRLLLCELHPEDARHLRDATRRDRRVKVLPVDGYAALKGAVPPPERRGLVLVDPSFEDRAEFEAMTEAFGEAYRRWPNGTYALWYPVKDGAAVTRFLRRLRALALPRILEVEIAFDGGRAETGLRGAGLFIVNPPYTLRAEAALLLPFLTRCFETPGRVWQSRLEGTDAQGE